MLMLCENEWKCNGVFYVLLSSMIVLCWCVMWLMVGIFCILKVSEFGDLVNIVCVFGCISDVMFVLSVGL